MHKTVRAVPVRLAVLGALALSLAGCYTTSGEMTVAEDGSGRLTHQLLLDTDAVAELAAAGQGPAPDEHEMCRRFVSGMEQALEDLPPEGVVLEDLAEESPCGVRLTTVFEPGELGSGTVDRVGSTFPGLWLTRDVEGGWEFAFRGMQEQVDRAAVSAAAGGGLDSDLAVFSALFADEAQLVFELTLPGRPAADVGNADRVSAVGDSGSTSAKTTFIWDVDPAQIPLDLVARTTQGAVADAAPPSALAATDEGEDTRPVLLGLGLLIVLVGLVGGTMIARSGESDLHRQL